MIKEALIVIPGLDSKEVGFALNRVVENITNQQSLATVNKISTPENPNMERIEITLEDTGEQKQIDIYEVFWGDVINKNYSPDLPIFKKVIFGLELILFWLISPIWKGARKNTWMFIGICFSGLLLVAWYISIVGIFISAVDSTEIVDSLKAAFFDRPVAEEDHMRMGLSFKELPKLVSTFFTELFLVIGIVLGLFPATLNLILRVSGFCMKFIKSKLLRDDVKNRIQSQMNAICKDPSYDRVTVFSHSLGVAPALDFLSTYENPSNKRIRSITVGGAISFLSHKTPIFKKYIDDCVTNNHIEEWQDYFSKEDWLCSYKSINEYGDRFNSENLEMDSSWMHRFSTTNHKKYFEHSTVIEKLIKD
jgi:hypothetical protein